jgi:UDP-N-acetylmuramate: L-alanyl-gamma-D-glutamyl-meso-diaminopimelate ligase
MPRRHPAACITSLKVGGSLIPLKVFGEHNLMNLNGARLVCNQVGLSDAHFYAAIASFNGAAKRLELVRKENDFAVYKDFAHSPSKLKATTAALKTQFPDRQLIACMGAAYLQQPDGRFPKRICRIDGSGR